MKSNKTSGSGYLTLKTGSTTLADIGNGSGLSFSNANWNGAYSQSYVPINLKIPSLLGEFIICSKTLSIPSILVIFFIN